MADEEWQEVKNGMPPAPPPGQQQPPQASPFGPGSYPPPPPGAYSSAGISPGMLAPKPRSKRWIWWVSSSVLLLLVLFSFGLVKAWHMFQGAGRAEIAPLHDAMKRGDLAGIFAASDPAYQEQVGQEKSDNLFTLIHDRMGDPVSYSVQNVNTTTDATSGQKMTLILNTKFTKGSGQETLVYHKYEGKWRLLGYHCASTLLKGYRDDSPDNK